MARACDPLRIAVGNAGPATGSGNHTYLLCQPGGHACLVDAGTGAPAHLDALAGGLAAHHSTLAQVLVTHGHADHASGAPALAARFAGARFSKHRWADDHAAVAWHHLREGDSVDTVAGPLAVLHTPGHAPDHLAFWHADSLTLFTGDLVNLESSVAIIQSRGGDLAQYLASLERVLALAPVRLLPAHGPVIDDPGLVLERTLAHRRRRDEQVYLAVRAGHSTVRAIADSIYDGLDPRLLALAEENVRAHLEKQTREGRLVRDKERWRPVSA